MKIEKTVDENAAMLSLSGDLDSDAAPDLEQALASLEPDITDLVLDLEGVGYLSTDGLRQLVLARDFLQKSGSLTLVRVPDPVREAIRAAGLSKRFTILS